MGILGAVGRWLGDTFVVPDSEILASMRRNNAYVPLPDGDPEVGQVPTVTAVSPLALDWETPGGGSGLTVGVGVLQFTETAGAGVYTAELVLPSGAWVWDFILRSTADAEWGGDDKTFDLGDDLAGGGPTAYVNALDLSSYMYTTYEAWRTDGWDGSGGMSWPQAASSNNGHDGAYTIAAPGTHKVALTDDGETVSGSTQGLVLDGNVAMLGGMENAASALTAYGVFYDDGGTITAKVTTTGSPTTTDGRLTVYVRGLGLSGLAVATKA